MIFRQANLNDLNEACQIIEQARFRLKQTGSLQWNTGDGYPSRETILNDIKNGNLYVCQENNLLGLAALIQGYDENYGVINGKWITEENNYLTIHRIAVSDAALGSGVGHFIIDEAKKLAKKAGLISIKVDTHKINHAMLSLLNKTGFKHCGEITLAELDIDNKREAFEYVL